MIATTWTLSDHEWASHVQVVRERLAEALEAKNTTDRLYTLDQNGEVYVPQRAALHNEIVNSLLGRSTGVPVERRAILAGGPSGAGKTTTLNRYAGIDTTRWLMLNPDIVKMEMALRDAIPVPEDLAPMEAACLVHVESGRITNVLARLACARGLNVIWDVTMSSEESARQRLYDLRDAGYHDIRGIFIDVPTNVALKRATDRHRSGYENWLAGSGFGGRYIPAAELEKILGDQPETTCRQTFDLLRDGLDGWELWDNGTDGQPPVLIDGSQDLKAALPSVGPEAPINESDTYRPGSSSGQQARNAMSDVSDTLGQLAKGTITLEDAARWLEKQRWPCHPDTGRSVLEQDAAGDADPEPADGFVEVQAAYAAGQITEKQYERLAEAAAAGIRRRASTYVV